jgi:hypothetical protein
MEHAMNDRRAYIKGLASRASRSWGSTPLPACLAGETRVETHNTVYLLRDGVCHTIARRDETGATRTHKAELFGMRLMGWVGSRDPGAPLRLEWRRGMHAVLWRPRRNGEKHSVIALTSPTLGFRAI